jgi:phosphatidylinositol 4-kinase
MGIFSQDEPPESPLAAYDGCRLKIVSSLVAPHDLWVNFICELVENSKSCNDDVVEMFIYMIHRTLPMEVGDRTYMTRDITALRPRFKLLSCALTLLQDETARHSALKKAVLRERIYSACFDYFCQGYAWPVEGSETLRKDILALLKFWQILHNDKKYIRPLAEKEPSKGKSHNLVRWQFYFRIVPKFLWIYELCVISINYLYS